MKLGCCVSSLDEANIVYEAGFDFFECRVAELIPEESDEAFAEVLQQFKNSPIPAEACNVLLPRDLKVVGESVDKERIRRYIETTFSRMKQVGIDTVVFGSGGARRVPDDFSREKAKEQIIDFLHLLADYAEPLGITIVIEPLYQTGSNIINSVPEAVEYVKAVNRKPIQALADFFHMEEENEPLDNIVTCGKYIQHIHVSDTGLTPPGTGQYPYKRFVNLVNKAGYNNRVSIECQWDDFEKQLPQAKQFLDKMFK